MINTYFNYLDELKKSGKINMVEAIQLLQLEFDISRAEAVTIFKQWMQKYKD